jgi:hypothetical protein
LVLDQDLEDFQDFLALGLSLDGARSSKLFGLGFTGFSRIFKFWALVWMVRAAARCLDQDLEDFQDFKVLGFSLDGARRSQLFGSGFAGFRGFFSIGP